MKQIGRSFAALANRPCWGVRRGQGSFLTFEFGKPRLLIREPIMSSAASGRVRRLLARRNVYVAGEWHLWIYCCEWTVASGSRVIGDSTTNRRAERAARFLDGQKLVEVVMPARGARTTFRFDLGGVLETRPYDRRSEQWLLYEPNGYVLIFRADRRCSYTTRGRTSVIGGQPNKRMQLTKRGDL